MYQQYIFFMKNGLWESKGFKEDIKIGKIKLNNFSLNLRQCLNCIHKS